MVDNEERLSGINPSDRILLLPHCLRKSNTCKAKYDKHGLQCMECNPDCSINKLRKAALNFGYGGICVAPGGHLAVNFVKEISPKAIVAVACDKELEEGVEAVGKLVNNSTAPVVVIIPLERDGCLDTEVDDDMAIEVISAGCIPSPIG
jgi:uncharacterized protein